MLGSLISAGASLVGGHLANTSAKKAATTQMQFQEYMSSTAHQREVEDLKAAGLNPLLSVGGSGASSPAGASYTPQDIISPAVNSAQAATRLKADIKNLEQTNENLKSANEKTKADTVSTTWNNALNKAAIEKTRADIHNNNLSTQSQLMLNQNLATQAKANAVAASTSAKQMATQTALTNTQLPKAENKANYSKTKVGKFLDAIDKIMESASPFGHSAAAISR